MKPVPRVLILTAAALYAAWILAPLLDPGLDPLWSFVSEYFVPGRPASWLLRGADAAAGALILTAAIIQWRSLRASGGAAVHDAAGRASRGTARVGAGSGCAGGTWGGIAGGAAMAWLLGGLALAGAATVVDAISPMSCAPSVSAECAAAEAAGELPLRHQVHTVSSTAAGAGFVVAMAASALLMSRRRRVTSQPEGRVLTAAAWTAAAWTGAALVVLSGVDALVPQVPTHGVTQRLSLLCLSLWLVLLARNPGVWDRAVSDEVLLARSGRASADGR